MPFGLIIYLAYYCFSTTSAKENHLSLKYQPRWSNNTVYNSSTPRNSSVSSNSSSSLATSYTSHTNTSTLSFLGPGLSWPAYPTASTTSDSYSTPIITTTTLPFTSSNTVVPVTTTSSSSLVSFRASTTIASISSVSTVASSTISITFTLVTSSIMSSSTSQSTTTLSSSHQGFSSLSTRNQKIVLGVSLGVGIPIMALLFFLLMWCCFRRYKGGSENETPKHQDRRPSLGGFTPVTPDMIAFPYSAHPSSLDADVRTPTHKKKRSHSLLLPRSISPCSLSRPRPSFTLVRPKRAKSKERVYPEVAFLYENPTVEQGGRPSSSPSPPPRNPLRLTPASTIQSQTSSERLSPFRDSPGGTLDTVERQDFALAMPAQLALSLPPPDSYWNDHYDIIERIPGRARARGTSRFAEETTSPIASPSSPNNLLTPGHAVSIVRSTNSWESSGPRHHRSLSWESRSSRSGDTEGELGTLIARVDSERGAARGFVMGRWRGEPRIG